MILDSIPQDREVWLTWDWTVFHRTEIKDKMKLDSIPQDRESMVTMGLDSIPQERDQRQNETGQYSREY
jgi:hypothetical protein